MTLSKRLEYIISRIPRVEVVVDVGTDHGKIPCELLRRGIADRVIALDISAPSLRKAENLLLESGFASRSKCVLGDGLRPLVGEKINLAIIAGMGGMEIVSILDAVDRAYPDRYVLSPHHDSEALRRYLISHGYRILRDVTISDTFKYYDVLEVEVGDDELSEDEYKFGRDNLIERGEDFLSYLTNTLETYDKLLPVVNDTRREELSAEICSIRRILCCDKI
ncbi:MAG: SAM-dependent methyltransferase [Clostridia bacterium]|nr:SAM-dependent methyltransferase [Clostridia bacterium]